MRRFRHIPAMLLILSMALLFDVPAAAQSPAPVLINYYVWWWPGAMGEGLTPDWPDPLYNSSEPAVVERQVAQMASAGIDGLIVGWYGPTEPDTERNFGIVLEQAAANGITALLSVDLGTATWFDSPQAIIDGLRHAINVHAAHPAYFRYNGKPVFIFWFQGRYSLTDWAYIRSQVDPDHNTLWFAEGAMPDAIPTFDGLYMYTISWSENVGGTLAYWGDVTRSRGGLWMATAMPGWDNTYTQQSERYIRDRADGAFYRESFAGAAASGPAMIVITSWNEWAEGTYVEPSVAYGDFYLNLTRELIAQYKGTGAVDAGVGSGPPVVAPDAPSISSTEVPLPTTTGQSSVATVAPSPTGLSRPTPTPPAAPTLTPVPQVAQSIAETPSFAAAGSEAELAASPDRTFRPERFILGAGLILGGLGLLLLGAVGALWARSAARSGSGGA